MNVLQNNWNAIIALRNEFIGTELIFFPAILGIVQNTHVLFKSLPNFVLKLSACIFMPLYIHYY